MVIYWLGEAITFLDDSVSSGVGGLGLRFGWSGVL